ncbi:23S rRNA (adenine(2503)-C(2))-methyltransferase RlmN [Desulfuribacillus alkaliarsenatis]|uniref:Probable dual-specificity RNA methyltransferase RlmN n=1 Tax=Desulfuribacillus alkaliarsenatis TaxID=766136 RepID=A0A1E5G5S0_9FIRM|nr:23S rRNA (adenine(2503)-C(2))-methyltransferase RlmN [Desulfuribacillus alkaliarsenatis]OEF98537.1 23S rRNA (adenine(2503)-C(2))-methyltransferase [Desulfuribacillus alkaliarsenatis]
MKNLITDYTYDELIDRIKQLGEPKFRSTQLFEWIYQKRVKHFELMTNLSKSFQDKLSQEFVYPGIKQVAKQISKDGTIKWLLALPDEATIETVLMPSKYGNTVCVSTQVGCKMGCTFCASTLGGIERNLVAGEIVEQVLHAQRFLDHQNERVSNVVIMGSGEPLDNYDETIKFIKTINHEKGLNIGQRHITISTCGIVPKIYELIKDAPQVTLSVSLHATNDKLRTEIMPINKKHRLEDIIQACRDFVSETRRRVTFEYALISGVNDQPKHAREMVELLSQLMCHVNLIPVNEVAERNNKKSSLEQIEKFKKILEKGGISVTVRRERGADISAACGQLRAQIEKL